MYYIDKGVVNRFFELLNENNIKYILIKNICEELPNKLQNGKDIDILVNKQDEEKFEQVMNMDGFIIQKHPYGKDNGWQFLYGLKEYKKWKKKDCEYDFYIDVSFELSCGSLTPRTWIPLDKSIQKYIWENRKWDEENRWWIMDVNARYVYYIVRCMFDKKIFSEEYIYMIENEQTRIDEKVVHWMLKLIFFGATEEIQTVIREKKYDEVMEKYISYSKY